MGVESNKVNRRDFLKSAGAAGMVSMIAAGSAIGADANSTQAKKQADPNEILLPQVPKRKLGKTGVEVPILNLGCMFDTIDGQGILKKAVDWGITYWDTAWGYGNGNSEIGLGKFIGKNPDLRKKLFIVSKSSGAKDSADMESKLKQSLERLKTSYIDLYYFHGLSDPAELSDEIKAFAQKAKDKGLIKFYGFSTHGNMAKVMLAASKLDWIDAIMTTYNFREAQNPEMKEAVDACHKANIGLVAMKAIAKGPIREDDKPLTDHFIKRGFTEGQAKLKAVWADERFATICCKMPNLRQMAENVAASLDKTKLVQADFDVLNEYAQSTCSGYCAGCMEICESALPGVPVRDIMRYVMYHESYGMPELAKEEFAKIEGSIRSKLCEFDYSAAESKCPHKLAIGQIIRDASARLA
jgi:predicted aldo/keto reductase-like oxidoreductase